IFMLRDGFNETELEAYRNDILEVEEVQEVKSIKGRYLGSSAFIDVTSVVDANLPFVAAHQICDNVEHHFHKKGISSVYVHPEP
ncbi:cation transporter dimerization domain-containing protein, partial [Staphylococcus aureus]|uniref:cation transporter dimerization domain-containing protein n=1 Tax=Staphylococcus aureus TaxID=1280 RepID=UPI0010E89885